jgi:hypothetical protein
MKIARVLTAAAAVCLAAAVPAQAAMAATAQGTASQVRTGHQGSSRAGFHLPYTDPNQAGWLTLCGVNLRPVTSGSITTKPFVWRVVSSTAAPKVYFIKGARATLFAYQPRPFTPAGAWSGTIMAPASFYSDRMHPMVQLTPIDQPLSYMTIAYPPIFDHLIQLRLYLSAPNRVADTESYAAADIQVIGKTWTLVAGGNASCTGGQAISLETVTGMPGASGTPKPQAGAAKAGTTSPTSGSSGASTAAAGSGGSSTGGSGSVNAADAAHTSSAVPIAAGLGGAVLIVAVLSSAVIWRRRRRTTG